MKLISLLVGFLFFNSYIVAQTYKNNFDRFTSTTLKIDRYNINVETLGKGDPIIFLSGGPGNSHDYMQGSFGHYYKTHQVIFIDLLGRGLSDDAKSKKEYSINHDVYIVDEVRKALQLNKITLVGHSYGAIIVQSYALKHPEHVHKMVLINGFHSGEMWQANCDSYNRYSKTHFPEIWKKIDSLRAQGYVSSDPIFNKVYSQLPTKYIYYHNTLLKQHLPKTQHRGWNSDVYYEIVGRDGDFFVGGDMITIDFRRKLKDLTIPTLIIAGRYDGVSTPEYALQYKQFMPQAQFVMFEKSGHNPYLEEPKKFHTLLGHFMNTK
ncbi:MAG: alpha/beta fold hydrolase [Flavobacteriales bacterium]